MEDVVRIRCLFVFFGWREERFCAGVGVMRDRSVFVVVPSILG